MIGRIRTGQSHARDVLGATSASDALGRLDAVLSAYDRYPEPAPQAASATPKGDRRPMNVGEISACVLAVVAVVAIALAIALTWRAGEAGPQAEAEAEAAAIVHSPPRLVS